MPETAETRERRLLGVLAAYYEAAGSRTEPDRREWLERHPDLAPELSSFFDEQDRLRRAGGRDDPPSREFGDYELVGEIGRGGMGVVFEARQRSLGRRVALKLMIAGALATPDERQRFRNEAESAATLDHPHIIPIHEVGEQDGRAYLAMKLVDGGSLADRLDDFPADPARAARLVASIARAVHHAHRRGVLHRDLKPANVLLDAEGSPYVADFGLAKRVTADADSELTRSGALLGSPSYMAPEQTTGHRAAITTATDVYGLGAVFYALLTGRPPFRAESPLETIEQVRDLAPEPPSRRNPRVDRDLETICLKALEKDPDRRYASAQAMADDLDRWLRGDAIAARPSGRLEQLRRWCLRPQRITEAGVLFLALGLILAAFCAAGLVVIPSSGMRVERPEAFRAHVLRCILLFYLPMTVIGRAMIARRRWAIPAGVAHATALVAFTVSGMLGLFVLDLGGGDMDNRAAQAPFELLCTTLFAFEVAAALVALAAHRAGRPRPGEPGGPP